MANFFWSVGYPSEPPHSGMIAYLCDLWNEGQREPLGSFVGSLGIPLGSPDRLRVRREWKRIDLVVKDAEDDSPVLAVEMKVDSHEGLVKGVPQTVAYQRLLPEGTPLLFVTLGVGEFYHAPHGQQARWVRLRDLQNALEAISTDDPFIWAWREAINNEVDLQDRCFSDDRSRIEDYRGKTWTLYLLGHLKEKLTESLLGRDIGIDTFVYPLPPNPDTVLFFGRSKRPAYMEINNNGLLNLKTYLQDLTTEEEKKGRIQTAQSYYQRLLGAHGPKLNTRKLPTEAKSKTIMSFDIGLIRKDGDLYHSSTEADTVLSLVRVLERFYGSPPSEQKCFGSSVLPPDF